jgi:hypothetical protein
MSVIAFKNGVVASDTACFSEEGLLLGRDMKVWRHPDGLFMVAGVGDSAEIGQFMDWCKEVSQTLKKDDPFPNDGYPLFEDKSTDVVVFFPNGRVRAFGPSGTDEVTTNTYALGANWQFTLGLLEGGMSPAEAVIRCILGGAPATFPINIHSFDRAGHEVINLHVDFDQEYVPNDV